MLDKNAAILVLQRALDHLLSDDVAKVVCCISLDKEYELELIVTRKKKEDKNV